VAEIDRYLTFLGQQGGSDLHVSANTRPRIRLHGVLKPLKREAFTPEDTQRMLWEVMPEQNRREFEELHDTDLAYELPGVGRFRVNIFMDRHGVCGSFRLIPSQVSTVEELGLPEVVHRFCALPRGLVLVTGPTGCGKSTTLAAMIDLINKNRRDHIITIEDPIEFVHENKGCLVNQREVKNHTRSFAAALRAGLREDPDVVLVGEMRDLETTHIAIETAETGHLVFGTVHTTSAATTVDRMIDQFPPDRQEQIRTMLSVTLKGVITQTLLRTADGAGRCAAVEVLVVTSAIANLIREGRTYQIPSAMQTGAREGMMTLNDAILKLVLTGKVTAAEGLEKAADKKDLEEKLRVAGVSVA